MTFAEEAIKRLREFRWANPTLTGDAFWQGMLGIIRQTYEEYHPPKAIRAELVPMKRERVNALNATLAEACGNRIELMTEPMQRMVALAVTDIRRVRPDVTTDELRTAARRYKEKHPGWDCTPSSVAKWWSEVAVKESFKAPSPYVEPPNWRQLAAMTFPTADFSGRSWDSINVATRADILKHAI